VRDADGPNPVEPVPSEFLRSADQSLISGERQRLAAALRPLHALTVAGELDDEALGLAADAVEALAAGLTAQAGPGKHPRQPPDMRRPPQEFFPSSPITGLLNPVSPPVRVWMVDGPDGGYREIRGEAFFDYPYEGPPTCVHGGVIAETFDEIMGAANMVAGNAGMTGTLTIRYRKPTPLRTELRIESRCLGRNGRKVTTWAGIFHGDLLTAEAEGIFIIVQAAGFVAIAESNPNSTDPALLAAMRAEAAIVGAAMVGDNADDGRAEPPA
jgi:Thioesterase superfamily